MKEIILKINPNESKWIEYLCEKYKITPEKLIRQLSMSMLCLYIKGDGKDQKTVLQTLEKYAADET